MFTFITLFFSCFKNSLFFLIQKRGVEVLFCYENYDEVVLMQLQTINGKTLISAEKDMRRDKDEAEYIVGESDRKNSHLLSEWQVSLDTISLPMCDSV